MGYKILTGNPQQDVKYTGIEKIAIFDQYLTTSWKGYKIDPWYL